MARARDTLSGAKHRRKRPLQRWRVTCLGRDSNERPNRPLRFRWGFRHSCPISRRNPALIVCPFIAAMGTDVIFMDYNAIEHDCCGVIWRMKPFLGRRGLLDHRT
ncbi:hypothetical protein AVEN_103674-1 [Araneus ventricosus]|uniref:Uncharacterized protein n=1 Tax=Araneus ventricosus TaxID=182803 RepID=A0A4Y2SNS3_ARAVE|nr:hypothetical protein AVEN_103674-1 [Araneus ventricosus]